MSDDALSEVCGTEWRLTHSSHRSLGRQFPKDAPQIVKPAYQILQGLGPESLCPPVKSSKPLEHLMISVSCLVLNNLPAQSTDLSALGLPLKSCRSTRNLLSSAAHDGETARQLD